MMGKGREDQFELTLFQLTSLVGSVPMMEGSVKWDTGKSEGRRLPERRKPARAGEKTRGYGDWWLQQTLRNPSPHFPSAPLLSPQINTLAVSIPHAVVSVFVGCHVCFQG